jgi:hypothetical protein
VYPSDTGHRIIKTGYAGDGAHDFGPAGGADLIMDLICVRVVLMDVPRALAISAASLPAAIASTISASTLVRP